ncbi:hypothetical protein [Roseinatronobacter sp.]|uniref:hypothetical protein n=1 Tax=Roseinatronobacter sp. TaxID=1945755 RepID=UPI003F713A15
MIVIFGLVAGALLGVRSASKRGGNRLDMAQYAAVGGIIGALLGLFATIGLEKIL